MRKSVAIPLIVMVLFFSLGLGRLFAQERFVDNKDGTVTDTKTNLMWAKHDNQGDITWHDAKKYCEHIILSRYEDWRMPTIKELETLYDPSKKGYETTCGNLVRLNPLIRLSCGWVWARDALTITAYAYNFTRGYRYTDRMVHKRHFRALPVRAIK